MDRHERTLVTTLTKKMAEDLTAYLSAAGVRCRYMHHDIGAIERMEIIRDLRLGSFAVLVGINLLREGLESKLVFGAPDVYRIFRPSLADWVNIPPDGWRHRLRRRRIWRR